ncbi:MAG: RagB/SusD family nutrient uptake outer membrane protein, partial [Bacteroidaceae bacterium]
ELIRRERQVELAFEGHRYFDTRTWMIAEKTDNGPMYGMNIMAKNDTPDGGFWERTEFETRIFTSKHYLFPISQKVLDRNKKLTQNYLW